MTQRRPDARQADTMTPAELKRRMDRIGMNTEQLAERLGVSRRTVQFWLAGGNAIPYLAAYAVRHL